MMYCDRCKFCYTRGGKSYFIFCNKMKFLVLRNGVCKLEVAPFKSLFMRLVDWFKRGGKG